MSNENNSRYGSGRNLWRKVYGYQNNKPRTVEVIDTVAAITYSLDLNKTLRHRDFFIIKSVTGEATVTVVTESIPVYPMAEYDEGLVTFNGTDEETHAFNFIFSSSPYVVLTVESASQYGENVEAYGFEVNLDDITIGTSAPFIGTVRYRAIYSPTYPATATSSYTSSITASAGSVGMVGTGYTASYSTLPSTPSKFLANAWAKSSGQSDVHHTPGVFGDSSTNVELSAITFANIHFIAFYSAETAPTVSISGTVSVGGTLTATETGTVTSRQWQRGDVFDGVGTYSACGGSDSGLTYTPVAADIGYSITCLSTNAAGSTRSNVLTYTPAAALAEWNADLDVTGTSPITAVADQSGNGYTLTQVTANRRPYLDIAAGPNGHAAFDMRDAVGVAGVGKSLISPTLGGVAPHTVFLVANPTRVKPAAYFYDNVSVPQSALLAGGTLLFNGSTSTCSVVVPASGFYVDAAVFNGASSKHAINNGTVGTGNPGTAGRSQFCLGDYGASGGVTTFSNDGYVARVRIHSGAMSDNDRIDLTYYLMNWAGL